MYTLDTLRAGFERNLLSGPLKAVNLFQINNHYFRFPETDMWIIDGGIELVFAEGVCTIAWSSEYESFVFERKPFEEVYKHENFSQLSTEYNNTLTKLPGNKVENFHFVMIDVETVLDYTMRTQTENKLVELVLEFDNGTSMQIALVTYSMERNASPTDFMYDLHTHLLISTGEPIYISAPC